MMICWVSGGDVSVSVSWWSSVSGESRDLDSDWWRLSVWEQTLVISGLGEMQILPLYHCNIHKNNQRKWFQCRNGDRNDFCPPYCRTSGGGFAWWAPATARRPCSAAPAAGCWWRLQRRSPAAGLHSCSTEQLLWTLTAVCPSGKFGNLKIEELSKVRTAGQQICKIAELNLCLLSILWHMFCFGNRSDLTITISE